MRLKINYKRVINCFHTVFHFTQIRVNLSRDSNVYVRTRLVYKFFSTLKMVPITVTKPHCLIPVRKNKIGIMIITIIIIGSPYSNNNETEQWCDAAAAVTW